MSVAAKGVRLALGGRTVLDAVDLAIPTGRITAVVGPNGSGKSTLLRAFAGLVTPAGGEIGLDGRPLAAFSRPELARALAYLPQERAVHWPLAARAVVALGRLPHRDVETIAAGTAAVDDALAEMDIADLAERPVVELSGGERARVLVARALAQQTRVYLMDEPFAGVDATTEKAIVTLLRELREQGSTVVVVHHDLHSVPEYFDSVLLLNLRAVAFGPVATTFTQAHLNATYGGRLHLLTEVAERLREKEWSARNVVD